MTVELRDALRHGTVSLPAKPDVLDLTSGLADPGCSAVDCVPMNLMFLRALVLSQSRHSRSEHLRKAPRTKAEQHECIFDDGVSQTAL